MYQLGLVRLLEIGIITAAVSLAAVKAAEIEAKVKLLHTKILQLPAEPPGPLRASFFALGEQGPAARQAVKSLAMRPDLSTSHQAFAGGFLADYDAFNPDALKVLLNHPDVYVRLEAVVHLADLGGSANRRAIVEAGRQSQGELRMHIATGGLLVTMKNGNASGGYRPEQHERLPHSLLTFHRETRRTVRAHNGW